MNIKMLEIYGLISLFIVFCSLLVFFPIIHNPLFTYQGKNYKVSVNSNINSFVVGDKQLINQWQFGTTEQDFNGKWKLESFVELMANKDNVEVETSCFSYQSVKLISFFPTYFVMNITKYYFQNGVSVNDQIIFDLNSCSPVTYTNNSWVYHEQNNHLVNCTILNSNVPCMIQKSLTFKGSGNHTEIQLDFFSQMDRTFMYHYAGEIDSVLIKVTIQ